MICISVQDNGFGVSAIDRLYIFDNFYRSPERNVQLKSGLRLRLAYVKFIVETHGGKISVNSTFGQSSVFTITIPRNENGKIDGLKGFPEAIASVFPQTTVQLCIIHQIRNSIKYVASKSQKEFSNDLKKVYGAVNKDAAENSLLDLEEKWGDIW